MSQQLKRLNNTHFNENKRKKHFNKEHEENIRITIPDDICYEIFSFVDSTIILQNLILVCKNWLEIIKNRIKFSFNLEQYDAEIVELIVKSQFKNNIVELKLIGNSENQIREKGAKLIASNLTELTCLDLSYNNLGDKGAKLISKMDKLTSLNICSNSIGKIGKWHSDPFQTSVDFSLFGMKSLTSLDLSFSEYFTTNNHETFRNEISQSKLKSLRIRHSDIDDKYIEVLSGMNRLTELDVSNCPKLSTVGLNYICKMHNLTNLNVSCLKFGNEGARMISELQQLTYLNISYASLDDLGADYISQLSNLKILNVSTNGINAKGAKSLSKLNQLTELNISVNNIGPEGFKSISVLKDNLKIFKYNLNNIGSSK